MGGDGIKFQHGREAEKSHLEKGPRASAGRAERGGQRGGVCRFPAPPPSTPQRRWRRAAARVSAPAAAARASRSSVAPGATRARLAARGAAAPGDAKVPGTSAKMPGSDTALTVDRTYSDPGRHQRCKSRVSGAGGVAAGAPGGGARPGGLRLPRARLAARVSLPAALPPLLPRVRPSPPLPSLKALGRGASEPGLRLRDPTSTAGAGRRAKPGPATLRRPPSRELGRDARSPRRPRSAALSARERPPRGAGTRADPATRGPRRTASLRC